MENTTLRGAARATLVAAVLLAGLGLAVPQPASAGGPTPYVVTTTDDELDELANAEPADLSLREAIHLSLDDGGDSTIVLEDTTYELDLCSATPEDGNLAGDLDVAPVNPTEGLTIFGHGATVEQTCAGERVLHHLAAAHLEIEALTITGGEAAGTGADGRGGGIYASSNDSEDVLTLARSSVIDNVAEVDGGGISSERDVRLIDTTIARNEAHAAGGVVGGRVDLLRTTVSHNVAEETVGGAWSSNGLLVLESTIVANRITGGTAPYTAANVKGGYGTQIRSSIIGLGSGAADCDLNGGATSLGDNVTSDESCLVAPASSDTPVAHPQVAPLDDNGGPTLTHRPVIGSPALDPVALGECLSALDQRGEPRPDPDGVGCDAGSVEAPPAPCAPPRFPDVGASHPFFEDVCWMDQMGITTGFADGRFQPGSPVTRQSMAAFLYRFALAPPFEAPAEPSFSDVGAGHPFRLEVEWLAQSGIAQGFTDGTYRPSAPVTRQAMAAFLYRIAAPALDLAAPTPSFADVSVDHPFFTEVEWMASPEVAVSEGYPDGTWRPAAPVSRQAMSAFLHRLTAVRDLRGL
jgi:hypothetical protein